MLLLLLLVSLVALAWTDNRLTAVTKRLRAAEARLDKLEAATDGAASSEHPAPASAAPVAQSPQEAEPLPPTPARSPSLPTSQSALTSQNAPASQNAPGSQSVPASENAAPSPSAPTPHSTVSAPAARQKESDFETVVGSRWMLVVGTIVLVLGMAFFVKYAFDNQWITETARVAIGTLVGIAVWTGGLRLANAGYPLYGRIVAGGGLAVIYITAYAAHALYGIVPGSVAFAWMATASAATTVTAGRQQSSGLALTAIALAYFAPLLVGGGGGHLSFFAYELLLAALTLVLTRRRGWPLLGFSSLYLAAMTTGIWASQSFTTDIYLSTELYLAATCAVFMAVLQAHSHRHSLVGSVATLGQRLLPVCFHVVSVAVLSQHSVAWLVYLVTATTLALGTPRVRVSSAARLAVWGLVTVPFAGWLLSHTSGVWYVTAIAVALGLYALQLLAQFLEMSETERPATPEIILFHANGLSLFALVYVVVNANAGPTWLVAAVLAGWNGALAYACRRRIAEAPAHLLALAGALTATAVSLAFVGPWITVCWAAEGAAVIWVGLTNRRPFLRAGGAVLMLFATLRFTVYQLPVTLASHRPVFNGRVATAAFIIAVLYGVASLYRRWAEDATERRRAIEVATVSANVLTVMLLTAEIVSFWQVREQALPVAFARQLSISLGWALYALGLIVVGFRRQSPLLRYMALSLFGLTVFKLFAVDLLELDGIYRIVGFIAAGLMLLLASFLYQRSVARR